MLSLHGMNTNIIDDKATESVADLVKIKIPAEEINKFTDQLNTVLNAVQVLQEVDTDDVEETSQTHGLENVLRQDDPKSGLNMNEYKNNKNFKNGVFIVKKVI